jgi:aspartate aminotransferase
MKLSKVAYTTPASPIRKLVPFAMDAKKKGVKIYHLNIGDPDIKTPQVMIDFLKKWDKNPICYPNSRGEKVLLDALGRYYKSIGINDLRDENLQVTCGGSEGLFWTFLSTCDPGDEVIVFEPFYANYNGFATIAKINLVPVITKIEDNFHLPDICEIEKKISKKTKAILICNPSNPTGTVYSKEELEKLVNLAKKHNIFLISDEVYREFAYDGKKAYSLLDFRHVYSDGIVVVDSLSKRYSLCGARLGIIISYNLEIMDSFLRYAQARLSVGLIDQHMAAELTKVGKDYFKSVNDEYRERRDVLYGELSKIKGVVCRKPEGAFYMIVKLPVKDAEDFAKWLLTDFNDNGETIMVAPAKGFYKTPGLGIDEVRLAYVINQSDLIRSCEILKKALQKYII